MNLGAFGLPQAVARDKIFQMTSIGGGVAGNWIVPAGVYRIRVQLQGGGGGGANPPGGGGGAGGYGLKILDVNPGDAIAYSVGNGGSATNTGGTTSITYKGVTYSATGGVGGSAGNGGSATNCDLTIAGQQGGKGTGAIIGTAWADSAQRGTGGDGGDSFLGKGGNGGDMSSNGNPTSSGGYGGGGGGAGQYNGGTGTPAAGSSGILIIEY